MSKKRPEIVTEKRLAGKVKALSLEIHFDDDVTKNGLSNVQATCLIDKVNEVIDGNASLVWGVHVIGKD